MTKSKKTAAVDYKELEKMMLRINLLVHVHEYPILLPYAGICIELERKDRLVHVLFSKKEDGFVQAMDDILEKYYANGPLQEQWKTIRDQMPSLDSEAMFHIMYPLWGMEEEELAGIWEEMKKEVAT